MSETPYRNNDITAMRLSAPSYPGISVYTGLIAEHPAHEISTATSLAKSDYPIAEELYVFGDNRLSGAEGVVRDLEKSTGEVAFAAYRELANARVNARQAESDLIVASRRVEDARATKREIWRLARRGIAAVTLGATAFLGGGYAAVTAMSIHDNNAPGHQVPLPKYEANTHWDDGNTRVLAISTSMGIVIGLGAGIGIRGELAAFSARGKVRRAKKKTGQSG